MDLLSTFKEVKTAFWGNSLLVLKASFSLVNVSVCFVEKESVSSDFVKFCKTKSIEIVQLSKIQLDCLDLDCQLGICYGFGLKIPEKVLDKFLYGVVNFHPGDLNLYRGRHPIGWALIHGVDEITLTSHLMSKDFDRGYQILTESISLTPWDTEFSVRKKVENTMLKGFIYQSIKALLKDGKVLEKVGAGRYLPSLAGRFEEFKASDYDAMFILGILRAKYDFGGVIINQLPVKKAEIVLNEHTEIAVDQSIALRSRDGYLMKFYIEEI